MRIRTTIDYPVEGVDHQEAIAQVGDTSLLAIFNGQHSLGVVVHQPFPRHWLTLVRPDADERPEVAVWLCDSLYTSVFRLTVEEVQDFIGSMGVAQIQAADMGGHLLEQEQAAVSWCAFKVTC